MTEYPKEFLELLESVTAKRPRTVIQHMYYAAMKSKACALTAIGKQYWRLVKAGRI